MRKKYVMIGGFAFSEESDMKKLKNYASKGWILEGIVGGFFYKFKRGEPQNIIYTLDYQSNADEEYFNIFKEAGWKVVVSLGQMHIFSSQTGAKPIYSDSESEIDKYRNIRNLTRKGSIYSFIVAIALMGLLVVSAIFIKPICLIVFGLLMIDIIVMGFNFMPYLAYSSRIKDLEIYGKAKDKKTYFNKYLWKIYAVSALLFLLPGIVDLINLKSWHSVFEIFVGVIMGIASLEYYKEYKKAHKLWKR